MKVFTLRESTAMASPLPQEVEELAPVGSEPGTDGCRVGPVPREEGGEGRGCTSILSWQVVE